jgi:hypothetical protein
MPPGIQSPAVEQGGKDEATLRDAVPQPGGDSLQGEGVIESNADLGQHLKRLEWDVPPQAISI